MQIIESSKVKEKVYIEKLENGLTVAVIPKKDICKKYVIWGTEFGSIDNNFKNEKTGEIIKFPDGIAHYLEHKLFEQENGKNSLDVLSSFSVTFLEVLSLLIFPIRSVLFFKLIVIDELLSNVIPPFI